MQLTVFACDSCGKKTDDFPRSSGWYAIEKRNEDKSFTTDKWHLCSRECLSSWVRKEVGWNSDEVSGVIA